MRFLLCVFCILISNMVVHASYLERAKVLQNGVDAFEYCMNCHTLTGQSDARFGPDLLGIVERPVASIEDYPYSAALREKGGIWTKDALNRFIAKPSHAVDGTRMPFAGLMSPHERADLIEYIEAVGTGEVGHLTDEPDKLELALSEGDSDAGGYLFPPCLACHNASPEAGHKIGPNLYGVLGRPVASAPGFNYSNRLRRRGGYWTPETLNAFFFETKKFDQGSHAAYRGLNDLKDRANLIAYLGTLKD